MRAKFEEQTSAAYFRAISIIHGGLITGLVLITGAGYYMQMDTDFTQDGDYLNQIFQYLAPAFAFTAVIISFKRYKKYTAYLTGIEDIKIRMGQYKIHYISHLSLFLSGAIFAVVVFMTTGVLWYLIITLVLAIIIWMARPTREKIATDLQLNHKEKTMIDNPDAIVALVRVTN